MVKKIKTILSIAASDPLAGAGIQQDVRVGNSLGVHVVTALTAITVQNSKGFFKNYPLPSNYLHEQLKAITCDVKPEAIKIGMIGNEENIKLIAQFINKFREVPVVIDPVFAPTVTNYSELEVMPDLISAYKTFLIPFSDIITPNLKEFEKLTGDRFNPKNPDLWKYFELLPVKAIIVKGGDTSTDIISDYLLTKDHISSFNRRKIKCRNLHGTGCTFSTLLAAYLAKGESLNHAFQFSEEKMSSIIEHSCGYKLGNSDYGPLNTNAYNIN